MPDSDTPCPRTARRVWRSLLFPYIRDTAHVHGTIVLLEACRRYGVRKFLFASSSSIYGETRRIPFSEDDLSTLPVSPYAATRLAETSKAARMLGYEPSTPFDEGIARMTAWYKLWKQDHRA